MTMCLLCVHRGVRNCIYGSLISHALALLPASEQSAVIQAELELSSWRVYVHAYPGMPEGRFGGLERLVTDLRLFVHAAAFSHMAYLTTIEHLAGREPMHDWEPVLGVGPACNAGNTTSAEEGKKTTCQKGWICSQISRCQVE